MTRVDGNSDEVETPADFELRALEPWHIRVVTA